MRRRDEVLVGLLTIVAVAVLIVGTLYLVRGGLARGYPLYAPFAWGAGLKQGQPVLFSGVNIGYVDQVNLLPNGGLVTTMRIYKDKQVPRGTMASIKPYGIFGDMLVALRAQAPTNEMHAPGDTILSEEGGMQLGDVIERIDSLGQKLGTLADAINAELIDRKGLADLRGALVSAREMFRTMQGVVTEQSHELALTQATLRRAATAVDSVQIDSTLRGLRDATANATRMMNDLSATSAKLDSLLAKASTGPGAAARFLNDSTFYVDARAVVHRLDSLVADIKANPKRYLSFRFSIW